MTSVATEKEVLANRRENVRRNRWPMGPNVMTTFSVHSARRAKQASVMEERPVPAVRRADLVVPAPATKLRMLAPGTLCPMEPYVTMASTAP